jgi:hypothetical protein
VMSKDPEDVAWGCFMAILYLSVGSCALAGAIKILRWALS